MKHFWALPGFLRLALASQHQFSVLDDLFAYPQYEVIWNENSPISEELAESHILHGPPKAVLSATDAPETSLGHHTSLEGAPSPEKQDIVAGYESMVIDGQRYLCSIPYVPPLDESKNASNRTAEEEETELALATERGWELLKGMEGNCVYFVSGWWSYSFCFNEGVRQFHQLPPGRNVPVYPPVEDTSVSAYSLGRFDPESRIDGTEKKEAQQERGLARMETKGELRYLVQYLRGGTTCDLTGKERKIEVQFHCQHTTTDRISFIKETSTCQYLMVIATPRLCNDVAFQPPEISRPHSISCAPVMAEDSIPAYLAGQESHTADNIAAHKAETNKITEHLMEELAEAVIGGSSGKARKRLGQVADIEIGGYNILPEGTKLELGAVVGGGKEKYLGTIAKSDGYMASERDLAKLSIRNGKDVEAVKKEVERVAKGKDWQLDVVETPRGRELRGIIGSDDDETEKQSKKKKKKQTKVGKKTEHGGAEQDHNEDDEQEVGSDETYKEEL